MTDRDEQIQRLADHFGTDERPAAIRRLADYFGALTGPEFLNRVSTLLYEAGVRAPAPQAMPGPEPAPRCRHDSLSITGSTEGNHGVACRDCGDTAYFKGCETTPAPPPAPTVVVSREVEMKMYHALRCQVDACDLGKAAKVGFGEILAANQWAIDAAIRERVAKMTTRPGGGIWFDNRAVLLTALGVTP